MKPQKYIVCIDKTTYKQNHFTNLQDITLNRNIAVKGLKIKKFGLRNGVQILPNRVKINYWVFVIIFLFVIIYYRIILLLS